MSDNPNVGKQMQSIRDLAKNIIYGKPKKCSILKDTESHYSGSSNKVDIMNSQSIIKNKQVTFIEALLAKKLGFKICGFTEYGTVKEWNPETQNVVSWDAIENGEWIIQREGDIND